MAVTRLWFVRHGEVEEQYIGTFTGSTDVGLSDLGKHQAEAIGQFLKDAHVDVVVSSPLRRARETAAPTAAHHRIPVDVRDALKEIDFGAWETKTWPRIEQDHPEEAAAFQEQKKVRYFPDGEETEGFRTRVVDEIDAIIREHQGKAVAIFAHAGTNRAILSHLTGLGYLECFVFAQDYGCVNAAGWDDETGYGQLALLNVVPGPQAEDHGDGGRNVVSL